MRGRRARRTGGGFPLHLSLRAQMISERPSALSSAAWGSRVACRGGARVGARGRRNNRPVPLCLNCRRRRGAARAAQQASECRRVLCVRATCGARALWGPRSGRDGAGRGIGAAQPPPGGAAGGPRAGVVAAATSAGGGCRNSVDATTCRAARGGAALRGRDGGQGRRQMPEAGSALTGRPPAPCKPAQTA